MRILSTSMPILIVVGLGLIVYGAQTNAPTVTGAGLVLVGMWSGAAVAELFTAVARPVRPPHYDDEEDET